MYLSPFIIFSGIWTLSLLIISFNNNLPIESISTQTIFLISMLIIFSLFISLIFRLALPKKTNSIKESIEKNIDFLKLYKFNSNLFLIWGILYFFVIIYVGGFPLYWVLVGDGRTYVDFGVPTLSGFLNMIRAFICVNSILLLIFGKKKYFLSSSLILIILISSAWIIETGRGNGIVLLLHPVAIYLLIFKLNVKRVLLGTVFLLLIFILGGALQTIRYGEDLEFLATYIEGQGIGVSENALFLLLTPAFMYVIFPIINLDLNVINSPFLQFNINQSVQGLFPTIVREAVFSETQDYGILINEANNTTSMLTPLVRDFGVFGAFVVAAFFLVIACYIYRKALSGSIFYIFCYPPFFMSVTLSFFSLYFTSLVVVFYPILVILSLPFFLKRKSHQ